MDGVVVEKREKQQNKRESNRMREIEQMGYIRHSPPIWWRDCVVRTLGLLVVVAIKATTYTSFALGSTDTWRQLAGSIHEFQGYVNNLLGLDCSYANKWTLYIYIICIYSS